MLGIIGGTGLYKMTDLEMQETKNVQTPFGPPSASICVGSIHNCPVAFLPRHGLNHQILPSEINYRANIWALKSVGVSHVVAVSAVGSLQKDIHPGDWVIPDQYVDWTQGNRKASFFGQGLVAHVSTAQPSSPSLADKLQKICLANGRSIHRNKTYVCVQGPRLGTKAESLFFQANNFHVVGMTNVPEVFLALEAQLSYCTLAVVTDYDCWMEDPTQHAAVEQMVATYYQNLEAVKKVLKEMILEPKPQISYRDTLTGAVLTPDAMLSPESLSILNFLRKKS